MSRRDSDRRTFIGSALLANLGRRLAGGGAGVMAIFVGSRVFGQAQIPEPDSYKFEAASVHLVVDSSTALRLLGGPGTSDPGMIDYSGVPLTILLSKAYGIEWDMISGPAWLSTIKYNVVAKISPGTSQERFALMLRNLLIERFSLRCHEEKRTRSEFALVVGPNGPKLKESPPGPESQDSPQGLGLDQKGFPRIPTRVHTLAVTGKAGEAHASFGRYSIADFIIWLKSEGVSPVVDRTGLVGKYDFTLEYAPAGLFAGTPPSGEFTAPSIATAVEKQLGLKLVKTDGPQTFLVVDHIERNPTEN